LNSPAFPELTHEVTMARMTAYSGENNIHSSDELARARGLGGAIMQGGHLVGLLNEMMTRALGRGYLVGGEIDVSFVRAARPGDTIVTKAAATAVTADERGRRIVCDVWIENQRAEKVVVGIASGLLTDTVEDRA
jgi:acyl dehydratase